MSKIKARECQNIEYKSVWNDKYLEWICGFANAQGGVLVTFQRNNVNLKMTDGSQIGTEKKTEIGLRESTLKGTLKSTLKGTQKNIVDIILNNPDVTISQIAARLGLNPRGIDKHLKRLRDQGIIRRVGPDKSGHWEVIPNN